MNADGLTTSLAQSAAPIFPPAPSASPLTPTWLAIPIAILVLIVLAIHMRAMRLTPMPASRRRIRSVNGWLMLIAVPLLTYAFGIAAPSRARPFVLAWAASVGIVGIIVMLAILDILNNWRLQRRASQDLRREMHALRAAAQQHATGLDGDEQPR